MIWRSGSQSRSRTAPSRNSGCRSCTGPRLSKTSVTAWWNSASPGFRASTVSRMASSRASIASPPPQRPPWAHQNKPFHGCTGPEGISIRAAEDAPCDRNGVAQATLRRHRTSAHYESCGYFLRRTSAGWPGDRRPGWRPGPPCGRSVAAFCRRPPRRPGSRRRGSTGCRRAVRQALRQAAAPRQAAGPLWWRRLPGCPGRAAARVPLRGPVPAPVRGGGRTGAGTGTGAGAGTGAAACPTSNVSSQLATPASGFGLSA